MNCKRRILAQCLTYIRERCPNVKYTLSDNDLQEIGAVRDVYGYSIKHQLCYWHVMRYVTERLSDNRRPRPYSSHEAHGVFGFVEESWQQPSAQTQVGLNAGPAASQSSDLTIEAVSADVQQERKVGKLALFCPAAQEAFWSKCTVKSCACIHPARQNTTTTDICRQTKYIVGQHTRCTANVGHTISFGYGVIFGIGGIVHPSGSYGPEQPVARYPGSAPP